MKKSKEYTACGECGAPTPIGRYGTRVTTDSALRNRGWRLASGEMVCPDCQARPGFDPLWRFVCGRCGTVIRPGIDHVLRAARAARQAGWSVEFIDGRAAAFCPEHHESQPIERKPAAKRRAVLPDYLGVTCSRCGRKEPQLRSSQAKALGWGSVFNLRVCPKCLPSAQREVA